MASQEIVHIPQSQQANAVQASDFMPVFEIAQAVARQQAMSQFIGKILRESTKDSPGGDYGVIPGASKQKVLLKPGAEKLCSFFGLSPYFLPEEIIEDWSGENHGGEPFFFYRYKCQLMRGDRFIAEAVGSCNSWESKYRYRWVREDQLPEGTDRANLPTRGGRQTLFAFDFAIEKAETSGEYGKPAEYWKQFTDAIASGKARQVEKPFRNGKKGSGYEIDVDTRLFRLPNPDVADVVNTIQKMAQKRALVAAVLIGTNASDSFTQDIEEDFAETPEQVAERRIAEERHKAANVTLNGPAEDIPEELHAIVARLQEAGGTEAAFKMLKASLIEALPNSGEREYRRILEKHCIQPKGNKTEAVKAALVEMYQLAQWAKAQTEEVPEEVAK